MFIQILIILFVLVLLGQQGFQSETFMVQTDTFPYKVKDFRKLHKDEFMKCIQQNTPILFTHVFDTNKFSTFTHMSETFPDWPIKVRYGSYKTPSGRTNRKFKTMPMSTYCKSKEQYYGGNNRILSGQFKQLGIRPNSSFLKQFPDGKLWIGTKGSRTPLHKDKPYNLSLQLFGNKQWTFFHRKDIKYLCYDKRNKKLEWSQYALEDMSSCPQAKHAKAFVITVSPGEMLYLPKQWSHDVSNLDDSVMVNFWFENPQSFFKA